MDAVVCDERQQPAPEQFCLELAHVLGCDGRASGAVLYEFQCPEDAAAADFADDAVLFGQGVEARFEVVTV